MRILEMVLLVISIFLPLLVSSNKEQSIKKIVGILSIGVLLGHLVLEGGRWQMLPIYSINIILIICCLKGYSYFKGNWFRKIINGLFLFFLIGLGFFFSTVLPVFDFPTPTGDYQIGSQYLHFTSTEEEYITDKVGDKRELVIKVWYPAEIKEETRESYLNKGERIGFATKYGLPKNTFNYLDKVRTNTFINPVIANGKFPVLIFSHGYYSKATGYYALMEEIVSHGFIVLNINHTYESVASLFPAGQIALYDVAYDRKRNNEEMATMAWNAMQNFKKATSKEEKVKAIESTLKNYVAAEITDRWAKDIDQIIHQIPKWEETTFLSNHIDTAKIGVFGHSQGGAAAGQALLDNPKIKAGINIDGVQWGNMIDTFFSKPFLLLSSDWPKEHPNFNEVAYQHQSTADFYTAKIKGTGHSNFSDIPLIIDLSLINESGSIEPEIATKITATMVVEFFDKYLSDKEIDLMDLARDEQVVETEKR